MDSKRNIQERSKFSLWMQAIRAFSFPATIVPVLVGSMIALYFYEGEIMWFLLPFILFGVLFLHIGGNLVSEYFDYKQGVDRDDTFGSSKILVEKLMEPKKVLAGGLFSFLVALILGLILIYFRGMHILIFGLIGMAAGYFYTAAPFKFKYIALGDLIIFLMFGPLTVLGTYFALTGEINWNTLIISIPVGFLVTAILNANNIRDIVHDSRANIKTLATVLGFKGAKFEYYFLVFGAFISVILMVISGLLAPWALLVLLSFPPAFANVKAISKAEVNNPSDIAILDVKTAQHHLLFGVLFSVGILLSVLI
jgi:1,4-dihydroxy-2-naphthoate octaprenyltransferase